jgi:DNA repair protein RecO (recombination protein O)
VAQRTPIYRDDALILRVQKLGESDRIITMLTRRHGRIRAAAKGVRRTSSRFGARLEPFGHVDVQIAGDLGNPHRTLHTVRQVESIELYGKQLGSDYPRYTTASAIAETAERLTPIEQEPSLRLFQLTLGALRALSVAEHASTLVLDAFLLRAMGSAGWAPALEDCAICGTPGRHAAFAVTAGGAVCPDCRPPGSARPAPSTLELMVALTAGDWRIADASDNQHRRECSGLVAAHLQWHLERGLRSLPLVDRGIGTPGNGLGSGSGPGSGNGLGAGTGLGAGSAPVDSAEPAESGPEGSGTRDRRTRDMSIGER